MSLISGIAIEITTKLNNLASGLTKAEGMVQSACNKFNSLIKTSLERGFSSLGSTLNTILTKVFDEVGAAQDRVTKIVGRATYLHIMANDVQALDYAIQKVGGSTGTFDVALRTMMRNISSASVGLGPAKDALKSLGLSANLLAKMNTVQQLDAINNALRNMKDKTTAASIEYRIFREHIMSTSGVMKHSLQESVADWNNLGTGISASQEQIVRLNMTARQNFVSMKEGFLNQFSIPIMDMMTQNINRMTDFIEKSGGIKIVAMKAAEGILTIFNAVDHGIGGVKGAILAVDKVLTETLIKYQQFKSLGTGVGESIAESVRARGRVKELVSQGMSPDDARAKTMSEGSALAGQSENVQYLNELKKHSEDLTIKIDEQSKSYKALTDGPLQAVRDQIADLTGPFAGYNSALTDGIAMLKLSTQAYSNSQHEAAIQAAADAKQHQKDVEKAASKNASFEANPNFSGTILDSILKEDKAKNDALQQDPSEAFKQEAIDTFKEIKDLKPGDNQAYVNELMHSLQLSVLTAKTGPGMGRDKLQEVVTDLQSYLKQKNLANEAIKVKIDLDITDEMKKIIKVNGIYTNQETIDNLNLLKKQNILTTSSLAAASAAMGR